MLDKISQMHDGVLDVLVPNAACSTHFGQQLDISEKAYDKLWDLNVKSTFFLIKECKDMLLKSAELSTKEKPRAANILVNSSVSGKYPGFPIGVYGMTKAALDNMVVFLAQELMEDGIRVNGIAPGLIKTDLSAGIWKAGTHHEKAIGYPE